MQDSFDVTTIVFALLAIFVVWTLAPVAWMVISSLLTPVALTSLPPDQRKQMEAMMSRQGVGMGSSGATQICISPEAAKRDEPMVDPEGRCKPTKMSRSGNTTRFEFDCTTEGRRSVGKGESTVSANSITSRMDMTTTDARGTHTMQTESQMTYLGPDCRGLTPIGARK